MSSAAKRQKTGSGRRLSEFEDVLRWSQIKNDRERLSDLAIAVNENLAAGWSVSQLHCGSSTCTHCKRMAPWIQRPELIELMNHPRPALDLAPAPLVTALAPHQPSLPPVRTDTKAALIRGFQKVFASWDLFYQDPDALDLEARFGTSN